mgnify:CR=1 FL=1
MDWYHGSPERLTVLRAGSTITRHRDLARIFSHKPFAACMLDDGRMLHTGTRPGFMYRLGAIPSPGDLLPHPSSTMGDGLEWLTLCDFPLEWLEAVEPRPSERLDEAMLASFQDAAGVSAHEPRGPAPVPLLVYGTRNPAKLASMRQKLAGLPLSVRGLAGPFDVADEPVENGRFPLENAHAKALCYWRQLRQPVFSCDSGLYLEGVPDEDQPGVHIRRRNGIRLDDEAMIAHYAALARRHGGAVTARYRNALCLALDETHVLRYEGRDLESDPFLIVDRPHHRVTRGFPLDALSVEIRSGRHYHDLEDDRLRGMGTVGAAPSAAPASASASPGKYALSEETGGFRALFQRVMPLLRQHCPTDADVPSSEAAR